MEETSKKRKEKSRGRSKDELRDKLLKAHKDLKDELVKAHKDVKDELKVKLLKAHKNEPVKAHKVELLKAQKDADALLQLS